MCVHACVCALVCVYMCAVCEWTAAVSAIHMVGHNVLIFVHRDQVVACCWHSKGSYFASIEKNKKCILWGR